MKLYEIEQTYIAALDCFTDPDNEIDQETIDDTLEGLEGEFEAKAVNIAAFARQLEAEALAIKEAEAAMDKRRRALDKKAGWLKCYVKVAMERTGLKKINSPWFVLSVAKNPDSVEVVDEDSIPAEFKAEEITFRIDKTAIKDRLKAGKPVPGARLVNGTRLSIR